MNISPDEVLDDPRVSAFLDALAEILVAQALGREDAIQREEEGWGG